MKTLEFFFDYISPYSYLASTQVESIAARTGAQLVWRPFVLGAVLKATGNTLRRWTRHYDAVFGLGQDQSSREVLSSVLSQLGMNVEASFARAEEPQIKELLCKNTDEAVARGSFGAPTLFVGEEMFIGNDRLAFVEKALTA
jgi:2-hydroxychromene-2-carboxylate isomerase